MQLISYIHNVGRWRHLTHQNLVLTNQTKPTPTVALTVTDTVMQKSKTKLTVTVALTVTDTVGAVAGFMGGPVFSVF